MSDHLSDLDAGEPINKSESKAPDHVFSLDIGGLAGEYVDAAVKMQYANRWPRLLAKR
jgi:hypothetical protein